MPVTYTESFVAAGSIDGVEVPLGNVTLNAIADTGAFTIYPNHGTRAYALLGSLIVTMGGETATISGPSFVSYAGQASAVSLGEVSTGSTALFGNFDLSALLQDFAGSGELFFNNAAFDTDLGPVVLYTPAAASGISATWTTSLAPAPEPPTFTLLGAGLLALWPHLGRRVRTAFRRK